MNRLGLLGFIIFMGMAAFAGPASAQYRVVTSCPGAVAIQPSGSGGASVVVDVNGNLCINGTTTTTSTPTVPLGATTTMSTAAPTAGAFSSLLAVNSARKGCLIQNTGTTLGYVYPNAAGGTTANAFQVPAQSTFNCVNGVVLTDGITGTCASGTCAFVISSQ